MRKQLIVYTGRQKDPMSFLPRKELFLYPFSQMISRTKHKIDFFHFAKMSESVDEVLETKVANLTFEECCLKRAEDLLKLRKNNYYVFYSGGIDSTGLVVALKKVWSAEDLKKVTIVLTSHSVLENPSFYQSTIKDFALYNYMNGIEALFKEPNSLIITGELGDQLFGAGMMLSACQVFGNQILEEDYQKTGAMVVEQYLLGDGKRGKGQGEALFEHLRLIAKECPFDIRTNFDFFWWFNFSQEWQFAKYKYLESHQCSLSVRYGEQILHFYDTDYFQKWSILNHHLKIKNTWKTYKYLNKKFIYDYTKDPSHLEMIKRQSLKNTYFFQDFRVAVNDQYEEINAESDLEFYVRK